MKSALLKSTHSLFPIVSFNHSIIPDGNIFTYHCFVVFRFSSKIALWDCIVITSHNTFTFHIYGEPTLFRSLYPISAITILKQNGSCFPLELSTRNFILPIKYQKSCETVEISILKSTTEIGFSGKNRVCDLYTRLIIQLIVCVFVLSLLFLSVHSLVDIAFSVLHCFTVHNHPRKP